MSLQAEWEDETRGGESIWDIALRYTIQWEARENAMAALVRVRVLLSPYCCFNDLVVVGHREMQAAISLIIIPH
jgi:hypothetical protein